jgi:hypothetical protein
VCGIAGLVLFWVGVPSIVALVLGLVAWTKARHAPSPGDGRGRALAGWIMGLIGVVGFVALIVAAVATDGLDDGTVSIFELHRGQCVDLDDGDSDLITGLPARDCDEPHDGEVFLIRPMTVSGDEFPGRSALDKKAEEVCSGDAFEEYVGLAYDESELSITYVTPSEDSWTMGDRDVVCVATSSDGSKLTDTVEASAD